MRTTSLRHLLVITAAASCSLATNGQNTPSESAGAETPATGSASSTDSTATTPGEHVSAPIEAPAPYDPDKIWFNITPYLWAAAIDATISSKGVSLTMDVPFSDIVQNLDMAFMLHAEVGWRRLFIYGDFEYIDLGVTNEINEPLLTQADAQQLLSSINASLPSFGSGPFAQALLQAQGDLQQVKSQIQGLRNDVQQALQQLTPEQRAILSRLATDRLRPAFQNRVESAINDAELKFGELEAKVQAAIIAALAALSPGPELDSVELTMKLAIAEFGAGYRVLDWQLGKPWSEQEAFGGNSAIGLSPLFPVVAFDLLFGARYYGMSVDTSIYLTPDRFGILPTVIESNQSFQWVDAVVGGRVGLALNKEWNVWCLGDVGGFYPNSQYSWCVQGGFGWSPYSWLRLVAGYRALDILYKPNGEDGFGFDGLMHGPFLGATFSF